VQLNPGDTPPVVCLQVLANPRRSKRRHQRQRYRSRARCAYELRKSVWRCANRHTQSKINRAQPQAVVDDLVPGLTSGHSVGPVTATRAIRRAGQRVGRRLRRPACRLGRSTAAGTGQS
jgi:hypothetical protein